MMFDGENHTGIDEDLLSRTLAELHTIQQKLAHCKRVQRAKVLHALFCKTL